MLALFSSFGALSLAALVTALAAAAALALYLIVGERSRHERVEDELSAQASFLESLVESMGAIASTLDPAQVLEQARREAEELERYQRLYARRAYLGADETKPLRAQVRALAKEHGVRDRRRIRIEPEPPVIAEQLALAV